MLLGQKFSTDVVMATIVCMVEMNIDYLVLCHSNQNRKFSARSETMRDIMF